MNVWSLAVVIVLALMTFALALLVVRVADGRVSSAANERLREQAGRDALAVMRNNTDLELAKYAYATKQSEFAMRVLAAYQAGEFKIAEPDLVAAIGRQLDGVAPPRDAPRVAFREPAPRAEWPNFEAKFYEERTL